MKLHNDKHDDIHVDISMEPSSISIFCTPRRKPHLYPGTRPRWSYCFNGETIYPVRIRDKQFEVQNTNNDWTDLDQLLKKRTGYSLSNRYAVLAVGSNACPARLADPDKYDRDASTFIPVFRGWIDDAVSVYVPYLCSYGSIPATIMGKIGAQTNIWITLLSEPELRIMDKSEGRGNNYDLIELPHAIFHFNDALSITSVCAYYESYGLQDLDSEAPILLGCFESSGTELQSMNQQTVQNYVSKITLDLESSEEKNEFLRQKRSVSIPLPAKARILKETSLPSRHLSINFG